MVSTSILSLRNVSKTFTRGAVSITALRDISLELHQGEFVALCGPSGSGKSSLLNIAGLTDVPSLGEVFIAGERAPTSHVEALTELRKKQIGFVFQYFNLLSSLSALENIATTLLLNEVPWRDARLQALELLELLGLAGRADHLPEELSGGEMQRVALGRAIAHRPKLLLADEPTGNLDSKTTAEILGLFDRLNEEGRTIILVTHEDDVAARAKRVVRLRDGRLQSDVSNSPEVRKAAAEHAIANLPSEDDTPLDAVNTTVEA
jgi:putative ABC transport system ATP-binding protein